MASLDLATALRQSGTRPPWLVEDLLLQGQMVVLAGDPGVGKSILAYTLALSVAFDLPFLGLPTATGPILYFDEENSHPDLCEYLRWVWRGLGSPNLLKAPLVRIEHFSLAGKGLARWELLKQAAADQHPILIVVDTVTPACNIQDENDNAEASRALHHLRQVQAVAGPRCTVLLLKHSLTMHEDAPHRRTVRGAKTWEGETDGLIFHSLAPGRPRKDGLRRTRLIPGKVRAYGLREALSIDPSWIETKGGRGLVLTDGAKGNENAADNSPQKPASRI